MIVGKRVWVRESVGGWGAHVILFDEYNSIEFNPTRVMATRGEGASSGISGGRGAGRRGRRLCVYAQALESGVTQSTADSSDAVTPNLI